MPTELVNHDLIRFAEEGIRQAKAVTDEEEYASPGRRARLYRSAAHSLLAFAELDRLPFAPERPATRMRHHRPYVVYFDGGERMEIAFTSIAYAQGLARIFDLRDEALRRVGSSQRDPVAPVKCCKDVNGKKIPFTTDELMAPISTVDIPDRTVYIEYTPEIPR